MAETWYLTTKQNSNAKLYALRIFSLYLRVRRRRQTVRSQPFPPWIQPPPLYTKYYTYNTQILRCNVYVYINTRVVTLAASAALACETIVNSEYNIYIIFFAPLTILLSCPRPPLVILSSCVLFLFTVDFLISLHVRARALIILFAQTQYIIRIALALETYIYCGSIKKFKQL